MPITALYAGLLTLFFIALSSRVSRLRRVEKISLGHGDSKRLRRAIRVHGNFAEFVPLTLVVMAIVELNGASPWLVHLIGAATLVGRVLHAWGLSRRTGISFGRFWGLALHWTAMTVVGVLAVWQFVRPLL